MSSAITDTTGSPAHGQGFVCFDHSGRDFHYLRNGGVTEPSYAGKTDISKLRDLDDPNEFLLKYWNWGYTWRDREDGFFLRLRDTAKDCDRQGFPGAAVHTVYRPWAWDYHVIHCADEALMIAAYANPADGCESFDHKDEWVIDAYGYEGVISRGKWYSSEVYAIYDNCEIIRPWMGDEYCDRPKAWHLTPDPTTFKPTTTTERPTTTFNPTTTQRPTTTLKPTTTTTERPTTTSKATTTTTERPTTTLKPTTTTTERPTTTTTTSTSTQSPVDIFQNGIVSLFTSFMAPMNPTDEAFEQQVDWLRQNLALPNDDASDSDWMDVRDDFMSLFFFPNDEATQSSS